VSKPITSTAIFLLIQDGKLALSNKVIGRGAVLGTHFGRSPYGRYVEDITIEHLLTQLRNVARPSQTDRHLRYTSEGNERTG
jgi:hypothetical protein